MAAGILPAVEPVLPARREKTTKPPAAISRRQTVRTTIIKTGYATLVTWTRSSGRTRVPGGKMPALHGRQGCPPLLAGTHPATALKSITMIWHQNPSPAGLSPSPPLINGGAAVAAGILPAVEPALPARRKKTTKPPAAISRRQTVRTTIIKTGYATLVTWTRSSGRTRVPGGKMPALHGRQGCPPLLAGAHPATALQSITMIWHKTVRPPGYLPLRH